MREAGADAVIVHARRAWLDGLNPAQNRSVPPINHERVRRLAERFSDLPIVLNGNLHSLSDVHEQLPAVGGVMLGRAICRTPWLLAQVSESLFNQPVAPRLEIAAEMLDYVRLLPAREWRRALAALGRAFPRRRQRQVYPPTTGSRVADETRRIGGRMATTIFFLLR